MVSVIPVAAPTEVAPALPAAPAIVADQLTKVYGSHRAIDGITFSVGRGEIFGFLGPNGAGKTTTMRILAGYTPATSGRAEIAGHDVKRHSFRARQKLGYLPENAPLDLNMTVRGYLTFIAEIKRLPRGARERYVRQAIEECGLTEVTKRLIANLSKGFRQRVGLAQATMGDPPVLILDEPTVGLDPRQIAEIRTLIKEMAGRRTVLLSTHILPEVSMTCQKVIVIDRGKIVASGTPEKLVSSVVDSPIFVTIDGELAATRELLENIPGVARVDLEKRLSTRRASFKLNGHWDGDPRPAISRAIVDCGLGLVEIGMRGFSLEDVFLSVIGSPGSN